MNTLNKAKKQVRDWLNARGHSNKITARTIDFTDLARGSMVFVKIYDLLDADAWTYLNASARRNGFRVERG